MDFDQQHASRVAFDEPSQRFEFRLADSVREDHAIDQFDRRWAVFQDCGDRSERIEQVVELDAQKGSLGGKRNQSQCRFEQQCQGAFGADNDLREVGGTICFGDEFVEVVAANPPEDLGVP